MKRLFDLVFSFVALLVFCVPIFFIVLIIKAIYSHPVIFCQDRIGLNKSVFKIFKFQTLVNDKPTKLGTLLRRTGLDELPQFINILKGQMSIVGPRALTQNDIMRLKWDSEYYSVRWTIKPGITGFAQVYGGQNKKTSWFWDKKYISFQSFFNDLCLLSISFLMNIFGKRRVRRMIWKDKSLK